MYILRAVIGTIKLYCYLFAIMFVCVGMTHGMALHGRSPAHDMGKTHTAMYTCILEQTRDSISFIELQRYK